MRLPLSEGVEEGCKLPRQKPHTRAIIFTSRTEFFLGINSFNCIKVWIKKNVQNSAYLFSILIISKISQQIMKNEDDLRPIFAIFQTGFSRQKTPDVLPSQSQSFLEVFDSTFCIELKTIQVSKVVVFL